MTKSPATYDALVKLIDQPSWHDNIRASALAGLGAAGDKRAMELGFRYVTPGNPAPVRAAALTLIGSTGKDDPRAFPLISEMLKQGADKGNFGQIAAASEALTQLGDPRAIPIFEELTKKFSNIPQAQPFFAQFIMRLKQGGQSPAPQP
jgi:HEAT repeat protein